MNILIVTAHPSSKGDTHTIAKTYAEAKKQKGHDVKIVDLYAKENKVELFSFENIREFTPSLVQKKFHEQILWAHEIVVVHPIWWGIPPSIMKNWVELTFWPGIAYKYTPTGTVDKLLHGKTAKIFATCGGPSWYYHLYFLPLLSFWKTCVFSFSGVDVIDLKVCGNLDKWKGEKRENHLQKFLQQIRNC
jgi:NAD(P)H dehydrogenase (quinone)